ncbi:MAG: hypothetical protein MK125_09540, partial [Dehalococcoidia bacterium]|nr:hypothetical protein [Dehalococcoidia bacterium]
MPARELLASARICGGDGFDYTVLSTLTVPKRMLNPVLIDWRRRNTAVTNKGRIHLPNLERAVYRALIPEENDHRPPTR